jgi:4'-phosphopantetheinyl transferase
VLGTGLIDREAHPVDVWAIGLDQPEAALDGLAALLSDDERRRADRFVFPRDRRRFTVGRAALRTILAGYLGQSPGSIAFSYGPRGKPALARPAGLDFNLAHSHELGLCAVTSGQPVGVDVEWLRPLSDLLRVAETAFSRREVAALLALPERDRPVGFFRCWTRKEAYVKARGDGLALPLDSFDVSIGADQPPALLANRLDPAEPARWTLHSLAPADGYVGALAVAGPPVRLRDLTWSAG